MILYLVCMILVTVALASVVPLVQYIVSRNSRAMPERLYSFAQELFDHDTENFSTPSGNQPAVVDRAGLANRGWVRCPKGSVMSEQEFEKKKHAEYLIDLP